MRLLFLFLLLFTLSLHAAEPPGWPLWDGKETVEQYAKRAGVEPTKNIELGGGVNFLQEIGWVIVSHAGSVKNH
jgi:hypothetical protein